MPDDELRFAYPPAGDVFSVAPTGDWDLWGGAEGVPTVL